PPDGLPSGRARVSVISLVVAEVNHLVPKRRQPSPSFTARVRLCPTSEPPVRSVIHCPLVQARAGSRLVSRGSARSTSAELPWASSVVAAPSLMARGQV